MGAVQLNTGTVRVTSAVDVVSARSPVSSLLARPAVTIDAGATLAEAVAAMEAAEVSALLVEGPAGIVTERDIARALGHGVSVDQPVGHVATRHPIAVPGRMPVVEACALMLNEQVRHLVVDVEGRLGVVSLRDVAAAMLQATDPHIWLASLRVAIDVPTENWLG